MPAIYELVIFQYAAFCLVSVAYSRKVIGFKVVTVLEIIKHQRIVYVCDERGHVLFQVRGTVSPRESAVRWKWICAVGPIHGIASRKICWAVLIRGWIICGIRRSRRIRAVRYRSRICWSETRVIRKRPKLDHMCTFMNNFRSRGRE